MKTLWLVLLLASAASGQCVMCQRTAAAQQTARAQILNWGILVLLVPPFLMIGGILWMAYRGSQSPTKK
jgi:hypothetical protein